jgi:cation diffusion facilitator CzcD-associated flavoprotein CzcO
MNGHQAQVAIVGAGPGGLAAAKWLKQYGFEPVIFEQSDDIGGQWNARASPSGGGYGSTADSKPLQLNGQN